MEFNSILLYGIWFNLIYNIEMEEEGWKKEDGRGRRGDERRRGGKYEKKQY